MSIAENTFVVGCVISYMSVSSQRHYGLMFIICLNNKCHKSSCTG